MMMSVLWVVTDAHQTRSAPTHRERTRVRVMRATQAMERNAKVTFELKSMSGKFVAIKWINCALILYNHQGKGGGCGSQNVSS